MIMLLKENNVKTRGSFRYLPLWSVELYSTKVTSSIEIKTYDITNEVKPLENEINRTPKFYTEVSAKELDLSSTAELCYFNFSLNFYEPFIEEFDFLLAYKSDKENKSISLETGDLKTLNFNLSTALIENIVITTLHLKEMMTKFDFTITANPNSLHRENSSLANEMFKHKLDIKYTLENCLGEDLMIATSKNEDAFEHVQSGQVVLLEFNAKSNKTYRLHQDIVASDKQSVFKSPYRRENFRIDHTMLQSFKYFWIKIPSLEMNQSSFDDTINDDFNEYAMIDIEKLEKQKSLKLYLDKNNKIFIY